MENIENMKEMNIALLIDVDNIAYKYTENILSELSQYGKVTIRRMYGDWSQMRLKGWLACSSRYSLTPIMQPNDTPGKNASDIGLIIDAMDILYSGAVDGFCIVSSDGDFNKLATRLRESGKFVIGMGEKKTPESFRASCERFVFMDILKNEDDNCEDDNVQEQNDIEKPDEDGDGGSISKSVVENAIIKIITDNNAIGKKTGLGEIGSRLVKIYPDFDIRNYNYSKLSSYIKDFDALQVTAMNKGVWVSLNSTSLQEIEMNIRDIFNKNNTDTMNVGQLKKELQERNPNLNATIKQSGVTKFSLFLDKKIPSIQLKNVNEAMFVKKKKKSNRKKKK